VTIDLARKEKKTRRNDVHARFKSERNDGNCVVDSPIVSIPGLQIPCARGSPSLRRRWLLAAQEL
jgi:hypothetical protein